MFTKIMNIARIIFICVVSTLAGVMLVAALFGAIPFMLLTGAALMLGVWIDIPVCADAMEEILELFERIWNNHNS